MSFINGLKQRIKCYYLYCVEYDRMKQMHLKWVVIMGVWELMRTAMISKLSLKYSRSRFFQFI